jgi:hypothetical protein
MINKPVWMIDQKNRPAKRPAPRGLWILVGFAAVFIVLEVVL